MRKKEKLNPWDLIGYRFDRNNTAVGNIFAKYTNAGQVVSARVKPGERLNPIEIARLKA